MHECDQGGHLVRGEDHTKSRHIGYATVENADLHVHRIQATTHVGQVRSAYAAISGDSMAILTAYLMEQLRTFDDLRI